MLCKHWSFAPTALCGRHAYDAVRDSFSALLSVSAPGFSRTGGAGSETSGGSSQPAAARPTVAPSRRSPAVGLALPSLAALPQGDGAVKPATVVQWHRQGFRRYWRWRSRTQRSGRPGVNHEIRDLIRQMSVANPLWGAPRIHGEMLKLGIEVSLATVGRHMDRRHDPPSLAWRTFLSTQIDGIAAIDMFVVVTAAFRLLYVSVILGHARRKILHLNVTQHPTAGWLSRQITEAFPWDTAPRYLLRDRDTSYGGCFQERARVMGIEEVMTAPRSPWQNAYVERVIGSIRRDCPNHIVIFNERHLRRVLTSYRDHYRRSRTHLSLQKDCPDSRPVQSENRTKVIAIEEVGGLHHRYQTS